MLLVIDAGNTNLKLGVFHGSELVAYWRLIAQDNRSSDEYEAEVRSLFEKSGIELKKIEAVVIASVVPAVNPSLTQVVESCFGLLPLFVDHTTDSGLKILYDSPAELGADRIADAVGAVAKYGAPCIVVDFGTATTFNAVNEAREYLGGVIAPGMMIAADALFARTAKLPRVEIRQPHKVIGSSTVAAMQSGLYYGYAGLVDRVLEKMIAEMNAKPRVVATGGLAPLIARASKFNQTIDPTLTLDGLRVIHERNTRPISNS
jgi:type III pantothenate kinase